MIPIFYGQIKNGKLSIPKIDEFNSYLLTLSGTVEIVVRKLRSQRSIEQLRYYWGVILKILSEHTGLEDEELDDTLKYRFLKERTGISIKGKDSIYKEEIIFIKRLSELNTKEAEEYFEKIRIWASSFLDCYIPLPKEIEI